MKVGTVVGTIVATRKHELLVGSKIQVVREIVPDKEAARGPLLVALDTVGAGKGEQVLVATGSNAARACENTRAPVDAAIIGIIDQMDVDER